MKQMQIIVEGVSEEKIQQDIERMTKGWRLFFEKPTGANYEFINTFWGVAWDGTVEDLKEVLTKGLKVGDKNKHAIVVFEWNGRDRFAYCTWTRELYDFNTELKHYIDPKLKISVGVTEEINKILQN